MSEHLESSVRRVRRAGSDRPRAVFTSEEKRRIFKGMVVGELEAGFLRYSKREELIRYAASLGLSEFEAMLLIAEAQYHRGEIEPLRFESAATFETLSSPDTWSVPMRLAFALVAAICFDLVLIYWLCT
jgi:hypothetical protein